MKRTLRYTYNFFLHAFALTGLVLVGGFFAIRFHITDVKGAVDAHSQDFSKMVLGVETKKDSNSDGNTQSISSIDDISNQIGELEKIKELKAKNLCKIDAIGKYNPMNAEKILQSYGQNGNDVIASKMIFAVKLRLAEKGLANDLDGCDAQSSFKIQDQETLLKKYENASGENIFPWMNDEQWSVIRSAIAKDKDKIDKAASIAGIEPRLIVASAIVEQVRLFHSQRELFKKFFEPLKILGNSNKISLGVMGIKEATAIATENNLKDPSSPYYLGKEFEHVLDFSTQDHDTERYQRLTTEGEYYYSYLYGGIYLREMMQQWKNAGCDITYRPEIVGTLFNVGFPQSHPNPDPKVGGSEISVGDAKYSFGSLAYEFYYSGELLDEFPFMTK